jgi:hypothetical protein
MGFARRETCHAHFVTSGTALLGVSGGGADGRFASNCGIVFGNAWRLALHVPNGSLRRHYVLPELFLAVRRPAAIFTEFHIRFGIQVHLAVMTTGAAYRRSRRHRRYAHRYLAGSYRNLLRQFGRHR